MEAARLPVPPWGGSFTTSISVGVVLAEPGQSADEVVAHADRAMYAAKTAGKNQVASTT